MPRFFVHLRHGDKIVEDLEGADYHCLEDARVNTMWAARELMSERVRQGKPPDGSRFEVADEAGNIVLVCPLHEAIN